MIVIYRDGSIATYRGGKVSLPFSDDNFFHLEVPFTICADSTCTRLSDLLAVCS